MEVDFALAEELMCLKPPGLALVDSLGTWVAAGLDLDSSTWQQRTAELAHSVGSSAVTVILVAGATAGSSLQRHLVSDCWSGSQFDEPGSGRSR